MMTYKFIKIFDYISKVKNGKTYINLKSNSSGATFFKEFAKKLNNLEINDKYILLNIDAPLHIMIFCKIFRRKIILRMDGLYSDFYNISELKKKSFIKNLFYKLINIFFNKNRAFFICNNLSEIIKSFLSNALIFQSKFVREKFIYHLPVLKSKNSTVILNAKEFKKNFVKYKKQNPYLNFLALFDPKRARKRTDLMLVVLDGINKNSEIPFKVNMYGYHEFKNLPDWFMEDAKDILSHPPQWLNLFKRYNNNYESNISSEFLINDLTFSLSVFDPCPNFIVESLSLGIPVIAPYSGGIPEIVSEGGYLVKEKLYRSNDFFYDDLFRTRNFSGKDINTLIELYTNAIRNVSKKLDYFSKNAKNMRNRKLRMNYVVNSYIKFINSLENN